MAPSINPRAILIDLDGTLADSLSVMRLVYEEFLEQFEVDPTDAEFDSLNGPPLYEVVHRLKVSHALAGEVEVLIDKYFSLINLAYKNVKPCPGAIEFLQKAKANRCTVGIVTSNSTYLAHTWLRMVNLSHLIDFVISGDDVVNGKPSPEPYLLASEFASRPTDEIVAVEDSPQGASSAIEAGLKTYIITHELSSDSWPHSVLPVRSLVSLAEQLW